MASKSSGLSKAASSRGKLPAPPPPPSTTPDDKAGNAKAKLEPTAADQAIFAALKAKGESKNPAIAKEVAALLQEISKIYKQP